MQEKKIMTKYICSLHGIKNAQAISDWTKRFIKDSGSMQIYYTVYSTQACNDVLHKKYLSYFCEKFTKLSLQRYESQRSDCNKYNSDHWTTKGEINIF